MNRAQIMNMKNNGLTMPAYQPNVQYGLQVATRPKKVKKVKKKKEPIINQEQSQSKQTKPPEAPKYANVALESGAVAEIPKLDSQNKRGLFDLGKWPTIFVYVMLTIMFLMSLTTLIILSISMNSTINRIPSSSNTSIKFFGIVLSSTVLTSTGLMLSFFIFQGSRERGYFDRCCPRKYNDDENLILPNLLRSDPVYNDYSLPVTPSNITSQINRHGYHRYI